MSRQEEFMKLLEKKGYHSLYSFCQKFGYTQSNLGKRLREENILVELPFLFSLANDLHEPIETLIAIFYPEELANNKAACKKRSSKKES